MYKNDKPVVAIEYKTAQDFISSMIDKRVFNQSKDIAENFKKHYVYVEGYLWQHISQNRHHYNNQVINQVEGALSSIRQLTNVVECLNQTHCFQRMHLDFQKSSDGKNRQLRKLDKKYETLVCFLMSIKDVEYVRATNIINELGLTTLSDLMSLRKDDLLLVDGIGEVYADKILSTIK